MGEESERQGMNHGNAAVSHPRSRVRMPDGHGDNSRPLPPAFGRKRGGWKMLKLSFTCAEQWGGNGSQTIVESQPDHPTPTPAPLELSVCPPVAAQKSSHWAHVLAWLTAFLPHITSVHFAT